jgi:hypothetical protein
VSKTTTGKRAEGVAQVIEHLPSRHKALSSNPVPPKYKKRVRTQQYFER